MFSGSPINSAHKLLLHPTHMENLNTGKTGISSWSEEERPRERLLSRGAEALTDAELVAILLRVGVRGMSAVDIARQLLKMFGSLRGMAEVPTLALLDVKGVKKAKVAQLTAAIEISRRIATSPEGQRQRITSTSQAGEYLRKRLRALPEEHFRVLYLNRRNVLLTDALIARGDTGKVHVSLRQIISRALQANASALIAAHNHPSGDAQPSESDRLLTKDLIAAARPLGIKVLDHLIVAGEEFYSFMDEGLLDEIELECLAPGIINRSPKLARAAAEQA